MLIHIISTDEDPGLRIESFAVIKLTWSFQKQNYYICKTKVKCVLVQASHLP
jgi:hypothetical protein